MLEIRAYFDKSLCPAHLGFSIGRSGTPFGRSIDRIGGGVLPSEAKDNCRKVRLHVIAFRTGDELNDVGAHEKSSDIAMTTRPTSANEVRQAVTGISPKETCGMIAVCRRRSFGARTLSASGAACGA